MSEETLDMRDEDRLPWLEAVEEDEDEGISIGRMIGGILLALLAIALVIGGIFWLRDQNAGTGGDGELIAAPEEDYRVRPSEAGGMEVEGQGGATHSASEGGSPVGRIDENRTSEEPVERQTASREDDDGDEPVGSTARIDASDQTVSSSRPAAQTRPAAAAPSASSGRLIQLGAYSSEASANSAWNEISGRRGAILGSLNRVVTPTQSGGRTLYRLRAAAGSADAARQACSQLRSAGESCSVVVE